MNQFYFVVYVTHLIIIHKLFLFLLMFKPLEDCVIQPEKLSGDLMNNVGMTDLLNGHENIYYLQFESRLWYECVEQEQHRQHKHHQRNRRSTDRYCNPIA